MENTKRTPGYLEWRAKYDNKSGYKITLLSTIFSKLPDEKLETVRDELRAGMAYESLNPDESGGDFTYAYALFRALRGDGANGRYQRDEG